MPVTIQPLPIEPSRDRPETFSQESDIFLTAFEPLRLEVNASNNELTSLVQESITRANYIIDFRNRYFGISPTDPLTRPVIPPATTGMPIEIGDLYYNSTFKEIKVYVGVAGWRGIGSYVTGDVVVNNYIRASTFIPNQFSFKNLPTANLIVNQYSHFVVQTNVRTQLNFSYTRIAPNSIDSTSFTIDLLTNTGSIIVFPSNAIFSNNTPPVFMDNRRHLLKFTTSDSGITWFGSVEVLNALPDGAPIL